MPVWLQAAGYKTALIGKYLNLRPAGIYDAWLGWFGSLIGVEFKGTTIGNPRDWVPPGWNLWYAFSGTKYYDYSINDNGKMLSLGKAFNGRPESARGPASFRISRRAQRRSFCLSRRRACTRRGHAPFRLRNIRTS